MPFGKGKGSDNSGSQKRAGGSDNTKKHVTPPRPTGGGRKANRNDNKGSGKLGRKGK